jgi:3-deoxy-D-arabino-heptulosonate 7-phosphate (DAHP) synthase
VAAGADGLMIEVHNQPELALSDSAQALTPSQYLQLVAEVRAIHELVSLNGKAPCESTVNESKHASVNR